jgi:antitoxin CptB
MRSIMAEIPPRLRWQCRRGMLELDVLLGNFLEQAYLGLSSDEQVMFVKLLECNDQELFEWLTDKRAPTDPDINLMIKKVRQHARNKN